MLQLSKAEQDALETTEPSAQHNITVALNKFPQTEENTSPRQSSPHSN